jgi:hypothetical protein
VVTVLHLLGGWKWENGRVHWSTLGKIVPDELVGLIIYLNWQSSAQLPLSVDPLINGAALIFHFESVNLTEERLFLNLNKTSALKIQFF